MSLYGVAGNDTGCMGWFGGRELSEPILTTGLVEIDRLVGGVLPGDNIVWEVDSGAPFDQFVAAYLAASEAQGATITYVSFNRSPQTISRAWSPDVSQGSLPAPRLLLLRQGQ